jgi:hypothetical protein
LFVFDRTIGCGQHSEFITVHHICHGHAGVPNDRVPLHLGTGMGRATVKATLRRLVSRRVIFRSRCRKGHLLSINTEWSPAGLQHPLANSASLKLV